MRLSAGWQRGAYLALATALISGVSVYINAFGVRRLPDPFVFTTAKNLVVALVLASVILVPFKCQEPRDLGRRGWVRLGILGLVGGSVPFLMFFYGLREASAPSAAFMHKTLFIWVALLAFVFLKERPGRIQVTALVLLAVGNLALGNRPSTWSLGRAELFTLGATTIWAVEAVVARRFLQGELSAPVAALGRMGFGAVAMIVFLAWSGRIDALAAMTVSQWSWVLLTAVFLTGYVTSYYGALRHAPATLVTSVLVVGSVVTSLLHALFTERAFTGEQLAGFALIVAAAAVWVITARTRPTTSVHGRPANLE